MVLEVTPGTGAVDAGWVVLDPEDGAVVALVVVGLALFVELLQAAAITTTAPNEAISLRFKSDSP